MLTAIQKVCFQVTASLVIACVLAYPIHAEAEGKPDKPPKPGNEPELLLHENMTFPGVTIETKKGYVDVKANVALDSGMLEVIACTPDSREHESIVVIDAAPMHIHAALLLLGAQNGNPAMMKPANEEKTRWIHLPPRGDPIAVSLTIKNKDGKLIERPISDFIQYGEEAAEGFDENDEPLPKPEEVFSVFVFAGSQVVTDKEGKRHYLADQQGNVVSISTFGDEVLCLPTIHTRDNSRLVWEVNAEHLPKVGTEVALRLRVVDPEADESDQPEAKPVEAADENKDPRAE